MIENWLRPLNLEEFELNKLDNSKMGRRMSFFDSSLADLKGISLAIIGFGENEANAVRKELYKMSFAFGGMKIADIGNIRREESSFAIPLFKDLLESGICPVIIGRNNHLVKAQFDAHHASQQFISLSVIDETIGFRPEKEVDSEFFLNPVVHGSSRPFYISLIGCQSQFIDDSSLGMLEKMNFDMIRLGKVKTAFSEIEPLLRDADMISFNLRALKSCDAPAVRNSSPSGFFSEEACQICRYAGLSDKLSSIGFYGYDSEFEIDRDKQTPKTLAQMIWYFIDGYYNRRNDFPVSMDGLMEYIVDFKGHDYQLTFWKSNKTGRWWIQVPVKTKKKLQRHQLIPCSYNDYLLASNEEIPERLINAFKRFD